MNEQQLNQFSASLDTIPRELRNEIYQLMALQTKRRMDLKSKKIEEITSDDLKLLELILEKFGNKVIMALEHMLKLKPKAKKQETTRQFLDFLIEFSLYYSKLFSDCAQKNTVSKTQLISSMLQQGKFFRKLLKRAIADSDFRNHKTTISKLAQDASTALHSIPFLALREDNSTLAIWASNAAMDCSGHITEDLPDHVSVVPDVLYKAPIRLNIEQVRKCLKSISNLVYFQAYKAKGFSSKSHAFLRKSIEETCYLDDRIVMATVEYLNSDKITQWEYYDIARKFVPYLNKNIEGDQIREKYVGYYIDLVSKIKVYKDTVVKEHEEYIQKINKPGLTLEIKEGNIILSFEAPLRKRVVERLVEKLKARNVDIEFAHGFTIKNYLDHRKQSLGDIIANIYKEVTQEKIKTPDVIADITPVSTTFAVAIAESASSSSDISVPKVKEKTRGVASTSTTSTTADIEDEGDEDTPLTIQSVGFSIEAPNVDCEVYEISGEMIPKGVFYAYGLNLDDASRLSKQQIKHYQSILRDGKIVPPGGQGYRLVRPQESGLDYMTFKLTIPNIDPRIELEKKQEIVDPQGNKKVLYCAGKVKFHKK